MKDYFYSLTDYISGKLSVGEVHLSSFSGEQSDFARLNHCKIRQAGHVSQNYIKLSLIKDRKTASHEFIVSGDNSIDKGVIDAVIDKLRERLRVVPEVLLRIFQL